MAMGVPAAAVAPSMNVSGFQGARVSLTTPRTLLSLHVGMSNGLFLAGCSFWQVCAVRKRACGTGPPDIFTTMRWPGLGDCAVCPAGCVGGGGVLTTVVLVSLGWLQKRCMRGGFC